MNPTRLLFLLAVVALMTRPAGADPGAYLSWDDCSNGGARHKSFACDRNDGSQTLVLSFRAPAGITQFAGVDAEVLMEAQGETQVPDWWYVRNVAGQCRQGALSTNAVFVGGPSTCGDPYQGQALGGIAAYDVGASGDPRRIRLALTFALPPGSETALTPDDEYYAARVVIDHRKTVGASSCGGCGGFMAFFFSSLWIRQPPGVGDYPLAEWSGQDLGFVGWQGACQIFCTRGGPGCWIDCTTGAKRPTWGAVKSIYR